MTNVSVAACEINAWVGAWMYEAWQEAVWIVGFFVGLSVLLVLHGSSGNHVGPTGWTAAAPGTPHAADMQPRSTWQLGAGVIERWPDSCSQGHRVTGRSRRCRPMLVAA